MTVGVMSQMRAEVQLIRRQCFTSHNVKCNTSYCHYTDITVSIMSNSQLRHVPKHVRLALTHKYSADNTLKVDQKHLESFQMWCCRKMTISWTDHIRNEEIKPFIVQLMHM